MLKHIFASPKVGISGKNSKKRLVSAYNEKCFWLHNGPVLSNLRDLGRSLKSMTDLQYRYHANGMKNDFASWVEYVLMDKDCASDLRKAKNRKLAAEVVEKALKAYS